MPDTHDSHKRNGQATVRPETTRSVEAQDETEPKGAPTSDRYLAETAHSHETHDPQPPDKKPRHH